ncbi:Protein NRT1/ PTR FAMILY 1.2 [Linum grandiflorum]
MATSDDNTIVLDISDETTLDIPTTEVVTHVARRKGGWRTLPFIIANEVLEKVASVGLVPVCLDYLVREYYIGVGGVLKFNLLAGATSYLTPIVGALASNSCSKFRVIAVGSAITLVGMLILLSTSMVPALRPSQVCEDSMHCPTGVKTWRLLYLFSSFAIMAIGAGGIRPCSPSFGADQIRNVQDPNNRRTIEAYYGWYYASVGISIMISVSGLSVYREYASLWQVIFVISPVVMVLSLAFFIMGSSRYVKEKQTPTTTSSNSGRKTNFGRVVMAAWRRRRLPLPPSGDQDHARWSHTEGSTFVRPSARLSILNRACLMISGEEATQPVTTLATVREVEELKALISVIPIWSTGIILTVANNPSAIPSFQAQLMDRHIGHLNLTPASYMVFNVGTMTTWVIVHAHVIVPLLSRLTSNRLRNGIPPPIRAGMGLAVSCLANVVAGFVEHHRRIAEPGGWFSKFGPTPPQMSGNWLVPQFVMIGLAEGFFTLGQLDFYNTCFPEEMQSIGNALLSLGQFFGMLTGTLVMEQVKKRSGWVNDHLEFCRFDYYYWLVAGLGFANFCYYLVCSWLYHRNDVVTSWDEADHQPLAVVEGPDPAGQVEVEVEDGGTEEVEAGSGGETEGGIEVEAAGVEGDTEEVATCSGVGAGGGDEAEVVDGGIKEEVGNSDGGGGGGDDGEEVDGGGGEEGGVTEEVGNSGGGSGDEGEEVDRGGGGGDEGGMTEEVGSSSGGGGYEGEVVDGEGGEDHGGMTEEVSEQKEEVVEASGGGEEVVDVAVVTATHVAPEE